MSEYMLNDESLGKIYTYSSYRNFVLKERKVNSLRKDQTCIWCNEVIPKGSKARYIFGSNERKKYSYYECKKCVEGE